MDLLLGSGDGVSVGAVDLGDPLRHYMRAGGFRAPAPHDSDLTRQIQIDLVFMASTASALADYENEIHTMIALAPGAVPPYPTGSPVVLSVRMGTINWTYFDVLEGSLSIDTFNPSNTEHFGTLTLTCLAAGRGDPVTVPLGAIPNTLVAYSAPVPILGDLPAYCRIIGVDNSASTKVIQSIRAGVRSFPDMAAGDWTPVLDMLATGSATPQTDASDYLGAAFARLDPAPSWLDVASAQRPASGIRMFGRFDVYARVRDTHSALLPPLAITALTSRRYAANLRQTVPIYSNSGTLTSYSFTWGQPTLAGSLVLIGVATQNNVTPTVPGSYTAKTPAGTAPRVQWFVIEEAASRSGTETVTFSAVPGHFQIIAIEVTGAKYGGGSVGASVNGTGTTSVSLSTGAGTDNNQLTLMMSKSNTNAVSSTFGVSAGFNDGEISDRAGSVVGIAHRSTTAAITATTTNTTGSAMAASLINLRLQATANPSMPIDSYTFLVTALDTLGNESVASPAASITTSVTSATSITPTWLASPSAGVDRYRIYWRRGTATAYKYTEMPAGKPYLTFTIATETGAVTANPPPTAVETGSWRAGVSLAGSPDVFYGRRTRSVIGAGEWEYVYLGQLPFPPMARPDAGTDLDWTLTIQARHPLGDGSMDVDAVWLFPAVAESMFHTQPVSGLPVKREIVMETTRDRNRSLSYARAIGGTAPTEQMHATGDLIAPAGNAVFSFMTTVQNDIADVGNATATYTLTYVPRFRLFRGST